jgi:hypothetical protein
MAIEIPIFFQAFNGIVVQLAVERDWGQGQGDMINPCQKITVGPTDRNSIPKGLKFNFIQEIVPSYF